MKSRSDATVSVICSMSAFATLEDPTASKATPMADLPDSLIQRRTMVDCQIRTFDVTDQALLARFLAVPRERFVPDDKKALAYSDIGFTMTGHSPEGSARYLLPPLILARLIQGGRIKPGDRVLDVACGGGYSTAILVGLAKTVIALEADEGLCSALHHALSGFDLDHVRIVQGSLSEGVPDGGPFDVVLVNGAVETHMDRLFGQLSDGGRLLAIKRGADDPTGRAAKAMCFEKRAGEIGSRYLFDASAPVLPAFGREARFVF